MLPIIQPQALIKKKKKAFVISILILLILPCIHGTLNLCLFQIFEFAFFEPKTKL